MRAICELLYTSIVKGRRTGFQKFTVDYSNGIIILQNKALYNIEIDYIVDTNFRLVIGHYHMIIADYKSVFCAGRIIIDDTGHITLFNGISGHYRPSIQNLCYVKEKMLEIYNLRTP
jgi:hypothetical protein